MDSKIKFYDNNSYALENFGASLWLKKAIEILKTDGIDAVKIEVIAKKIGKSKGSFYHFFKNREDLLTEILEYYGKIFDYQTTKFYESLTGDPSEKLWKTVQFRMKMNSRDLDTAIKFWGKKDKRAQEKYENILLATVDRITVIFLELGFNEDEALIRSRSLLSLVRGDDFNKIQNIPEEKAFQLTRLQYDLLISRKSDSMEYGKERNQKHN